MQPAGWQGGKEGEFWESTERKSWSANELPINLPACVVWKRFLCMQHIFGGLTGIEQGRNWPFKKILDIYFFENLQNTAEALKKKSLAV